MASNSTGIISSEFLVAADFDKYKILEMVEDLGIVSVQFKDKKAGYFVTVYNTLLERISKPPQHIKSYIPSLLGDGDYRRF